MKTKTKVSIVFWVIMLGSAALGAIFPKVIDGALVVAGFALLFSLNNLAELA